MKPSKEHRNLIRMEKWSSQTGWSFKRESFQTGYFDWIRANSNSISWCVKAKLLSHYSPFLGAKMSERQSRVTTWGALYEGAIYDWLISYHEIYSNCRYRSWIHDSINHDEDIFGQSPGIATFTKTCCHRYCAWTVHEKHTMSDLLTDYVISW